MAAIQSETIVGISRHHFRIPTRNWTWFLAPFLLLAIGYLGLRVGQSDFYPLIGIYTFLFLSYLVIYRWSTPESLGFWWRIGIAMRLILVFCLPLLSDDVYRFIWDGQLVIQGYNPFHYLPSTLMEEGPAIQGLTPDLYEALNSPNYYTIYPPIAQATFAIATYLFPTSIYGAAVVMKVFLFLFELGSVWLIIRLLAHWQMPIKNSLLYALNPLIIIEVCGNLHYEGAMVFFLLLGIWLIVKGRFYSSAAMLAFSVASKLLPLMFFPFWVRRLGGRGSGEVGEMSSGEVVNKGSGEEGNDRSGEAVKVGGRIYAFIQKQLKALLQIDIKKNILYFGFAFIVLAALFSPLLNRVFIQNFGNSIGLYFQKFEFNASIYYLLRWVGFQFVGYNIIATIGPRLAMGTLTGIVLLFALERNPKWERLPLQLLWAICLYLLFTTTVHPWYTSLPIVLCLFTRFRFPIIWSGLIYLTYINYSTEVYHENLWVVGIEYGVVGIVFFVELLRSKSARPLFS